MSKLLSTKLKTAGQVDGEPRHLFGVFAPPPRARYPYRTLVVGTNPLKDMPPCN